MKRLTNTCTRIWFAREYCFSLFCFYTILRCGSSFTLQHYNLQTLRPRADATVQNYLVYHGTCTTFGPCEKLKCYLLPIRSYDEQFQFYNDKAEIKLELCIVEETDLYDVSKFVVQTFGADAISLSQDISRIEKMLVKPAVDLLNGYSGLVAFAEVLAGIRSRVRLRTMQNNVPDIGPPPIDGLPNDQQIRIAEGTSIILVAVSRSLDGERIEIVGSIELRLQPCDAKIPFTLPVLDKIERFVANMIRKGEKQKMQDLQPYLSNLCVDENYRGQGIGRALVRCVEDIASNVWGYSNMYLHVDIENKPAMALYKNEGYVDVGRRWMHFWVGMAADIGYYVKKLPDYRRIDNA